MLAAGWLLYAFDSLAFNLSVLHFASGAVTTGTCFTGVLNYTRLGKLQAARPVGVALFAGGSVSQVFQMTLTNRRHERAKEEWANGNGVAIDHTTSKSFGQHGMTEDYVAAGAHAAITQIFRDLVEPENMASVSTLIHEQAANVARQAITEEGRKGSRTSAMEAVTGSYDALERKYHDWWKSMPPSTATLFCTACALLGLLLLGLSLALWRFVIFGLT